MANTCSICKQPGHNSKTCGSKASGKLRTPKAEPAAESGTVLAQLEARHARLKKELELIERLMPDLRALAALSAVAILVAVFGLLCMGPMARRASAATPPASKAVHYPRRWVWVMTTGSGDPVLKAGVIDSAFGRAVARYDVVSSPAAPLRFRPDIVAFWRANNPAVTVIAYVAGSVWNNPTPFLGDTTNDFSFARWRIVRNFNALLYTRSGRILDPWSNIDFSNHRMALQLADTTASIIKTPGVDGIFLDSFCKSVAWEQTPVDSIDYMRAGFSCFTDWESAYQTGHRMYAERIRQIIGTKLLLGNAGSSGERDVFNGWMREGFPGQNGGTWESNMIATSWGDPGYLPDQRLYVQPSLCFLTNCWVADSTQRAKAFLFGLASATLGDGVFTMTRCVAPSDPNPFGLLDWPKEYNLDLGAPWSRAFRSGTSTYRREFSRGFVEVDYLARTGRIVAR